MVDSRVLLRAATGWMLALLATTALGCGSNDAADPKARTAPGLSAAARGELLATGRRVFVEQCDFCHRINGKRAPRTPPPDAYGSSFDEIETSEAFVMRRVRDGFGGMQSFSGELTPREIRAVATYVIANQGGDVAAPKPSPARFAAGEDVFEARCQRCHSIADRPQTGKPEETTAAWQATDFRVVKPSAPFVESVLDGTGNAFMIELMPEVQGKLSQAEIRDVAAYVTAVAKAGVPRD